MSENDCVRVAVRIRPLVRSETDRGCQSSVEKIPGEPQLTVNKADAFTFNYVFDPNDSQELLYKSTIYDMIDKLFKGYNVTILAYGQTGSGKTYTMGTSYDGSRSEDMGVIPRAMKDIFQRVDSKASECDFKVTCSFMELYQEQLYDLLAPSTKVIEMREDRNGIIMPGLTEEIVKSTPEATNCLLRGSSGRAVASTAMNEQSSRSHAIFTITIQARSKSEIKNLVTSKFHLVDLAGSERSKKTKATGDRFKEGVKINQGLLALGNVISALGTNTNSGYVSFRDSKLTRLLQDSLGGNSVTLMIACISPADYNVPETLSTLRYADRARKIKNKPIINQDPHAAEILHLKDVIRKLQMELLNRSYGIINSSVEDLSCDDQCDDVKSVPYNDLLEKNRQLQAQLQNTLYNVADNEMRAHIAEAAYEKIKTKIEQITGLIVELCTNVNESSFPAELMEHVKNLKNIRNVVEDLGVDLKISENEINDNKRHQTASPLDTDSDSGDNPEHNEFMQQQGEAFTNKQMDLNQKLQQLMRELTLKEELHQKVSTNLVKFHTLGEDMGEKFGEYQAKIEALELEKSELLEKLKTAKDKVSVKLAEERRKRLQVLEQEITEMKRKNLQQAKLLKVREKENEKIKVLQQDIQAMKEYKVKLIRTMRMESEKFRQFKFTREKELMQLKNQDRKMKNEMARKEMLHVKQNNVLKRKCEEALAINKRLKDALERQREAQLKRNKYLQNKNANKFEQIVSWVDDELNVVSSLIDAENSLEILMEHRSQVTSRINALKEGCTEDGDDNQSLLTSLEEGLKLQNIQIADLQQKVVSTDVDLRIKGICDGIQSVPEARVALKHVFDSLIDIRRDYAAKLLDQNTARESIEEKLKLTEKEMKQCRKELEEKRVESENMYEEKIAILLRQLHSRPQDTKDPEMEQRMAIEEETLNKLEDVREELEIYKKRCSELENKINTKRKLLKPKQPSIKEENGRLEDDMHQLISSSSDEDNADDNSDDPDWTKTPRYKRMTRSSREKTSDVSSEIKCKCLKGCSTRRCKCKLNDAQCGDHCKCSTDCVNRLSNQLAGNSSDDKENTPSDSVISDTPTFYKQMNTSQMPTLLFNPPSAKKKFFG